MTLLHYALKPNGYLLLGTSETVDRPDLFKPEIKSINLYRRRNLPAHERQLPVMGAPVINRARGKPTAHVERELSYGAMPASHWVTRAGHHTSL